MSVHLGLAFPQGDLKAWTGARPVLSVGFEQCLDFSEDEYFRLRFDWAHFKGRPTLLVPTPGLRPLPLGTPMPYEVQTMENAFTQASLGLDAVYCFSGSPAEGVYLLGGLGIAFTKLNSTVAPSPTGNGTLWPKGTTHLVETSNKPFVVIGAGYQIDRRFGVESRITWGQGAYREIKLNLTSVWIGMTYRFSDFS